MTNGDIIINSTNMNECNIKLDMTITPEQLAKLFWNMNEKAQAKFFNHLAEVDTKTLIELQLCGACKPALLTDNARDMINSLNYFANHTD